jgi:hypothetical protein
MKSFQGIRVDGNKVIVKMATNDDARKMCGKLLDFILQEKPSATSDTSDSKHDVNQ